MTAENCQKIIAYLEGELKSLRANHTKLERELMIPSGGSSFADATATGVTPSNILTPNEKLTVLDEAAKAKQMELVMQRGLVAAAKSPTYAQTILKDIVDLKMSPTLKREFEYHQKKILY